MGKAGNDAGFAAVAGSHAAQRVQGGEAAGVPAALRHDEPAPGPAAQLRLPGALLLRAAPGAHQRGPGTSWAPCATAVVARGAARPAAVALPLLRVSPCWAGIKRSVQTAWIVSEMEEGKEELLPGS